MNTDSYQALQSWLAGRNYQLVEVENQYILKQNNQQLATITPPDRYQVKNVDMTFNEWVEFNKCIRNIRHYLMTAK